ncbi:hypothetical protein ACFTY7_38790 [Streptomyces sp. NPDC057062]|uniref:hypothetical protein n=1 Tax=Streptomyces sp. NPDC057062 TaxID=3346011 RepID=UPI00362CB40B
MAKIDPIARAAEMSARGLILKAPYPGADKPWPAICKTCKNPTRSSYTSVITKGQGPCFTCGQRKSSAAASLKRAVPADVAEAKIREANVEPLEDFPGTQGTWRCLCLTCLHEIDVWYSSVVYAGNGACDYCSGSREIPDTDARAELLALGLEALVPYPGSNVKWRSRCTTCKKIVDPTLCNARKTKFPCRYCAQRATDPDVAVEIMKEAGLKPLAPFPGSVKAVWKAEHIACGKQVDAVLDKVIQRRRASCIHCVRYGFKPGLPAFLYLMVHIALGAAKVGICNEGSGRIRDHERNGWKQVLIRPLPGYHAMRAEQHVLDRWLLLDLPQGVSRLDMPQGGWTETVALCDRTLPRLRKDFHAAIDATLEVGLDELTEDCGSDEDSSYLF